MPCWHCGRRGNCGKYEGPRIAPCGVLPPPVEIDPYHLVGGPKDVTPEQRHYPDYGTMDKLPPIWGTELPKFETYRPWAVNPNGVIGQTHNMTLADVCEAYNFEDLALGDYPIWDESKRSWLNERIIYHFWMREIRGETPAQFMRFISRHMHEIMPTVNVIFASLADVTPDAIRNDTNFWRTSDFTGNVVGNDTAQSETNSESNVVSSSVSIASSNPLQSKVLHDESDYYDSGSKTDGTSTSTSTTKSNSTDDTTQDTKNNTTDHDAGYTGRSLSKAVTEWFNGVNNALLIVLNDLESCFSQLYTDHANTMY